MTNPYQTLKVSQTATPEEIQSAYRALAKENHPDRNPGDNEAVARFKEIQEAYEILSDPERRARYDATGDTSAPKNKDAEVMATLTMIFDRVLYNHMSSPNFSNRIDLIEKMRIDMEKAVVTGDQERRRLERVVSQLNSIIDRFTVNEEGVENFPQQVIRNHIARAERGLASCKAELDKLERSLAHLKKFGYKIDEEKNILWSASTYSPAITWG